MRSVKLLHFADLHASQRTIEKASRALAFIHGFADERRPDLILIAGDLWDGTVEVTTQSPLYKVVDWIRELTEICPVVLLAGTPSHDRAGSLDIFQRIETSNHIYVLDRPTPTYIGDCLVLPVPGLTKSGLAAWEHNRNLMLAPEQSNAEVAGLVRSLFFSFRAHLENVKCDLPGATHPEARNESPHVVPILLGHFTVNGAETPTGQILTGGDIVISSADITEAGAVINCLGHIHKPQTIGDNIIYSGSPYPCNWGEKEPRSFVWAEVNAHEIISLERIPTPFPAMIDVETEYDIDSLKLVFHGLPENLDEIDGADLRVRVSLPPEFQGFIDENDIKVAIEEEGLNPNSIKFEKVIASRSRERCEIITRVTTNTERLNAWGNTTGTDVTVGAAVKLEDIEETLETDNRIKGAQGEIRLISLKLRGAKGIKWADEIRIDFIHFNSDMILFDADNGAGKTTIFDNLHPYPFLPYYQGINFNAKIADAFRLEDSCRELTVEIDGVYYCFEIKVDALRGKAEYYVSRRIECTQDELPPYAWEALNDGKKPSYKDIVLELFGGPELYLQTVYQVQESKGLIGQTNASIKDLFYEFLDLGQYQTLAEALKKAGEKVYQEIVFKETEITGADEKVKQAENLASEIDRHVQKAAEWQATLNGLSEEKGKLEEQIKALEKSSALQETSRKALADITARVKELESEIATKNDKFDKWFNAQLLKIAQVNDKLDSDARLIEQKDHILQMLEKAEEHGRINTECQNQREILRARKKELEQNRYIYDSKVSACRQKIGGIEKDIEAANKLAGELENVPCQKLPPETAKTCQECPLIAEAVKAEKSLPLLQENLSTQMKEKAELPSWDSESQSLQKEIDTIVARLSELDNQLKAIPEEAGNIDWRARNSQLQAALVRGEELQNQLTELANTLNDQRKQYDENMPKLKSQLNELKDQKEKAAAQIDDKVEQELKTARNHLRLVEGRINDCNEGILTAERQKAAAEARLADLKEIEQKVADDRQRLEELKTDHAEYTVLQTAFSRNGIPALLMENSLPQIAELTNSLLAEFSAGMQVRFDTTREKADGKGQIETFDIIVIDESGERPIELLSGGQKVPFIVAMQTALSIHRARQSGFHPKFAIVDECDGPLRDFRASALFGMLQKRMELAGLEQLLLVTHRRELAEQCAQKVILDVDNGKIVEVN